MIWETPGDPIARTHSRFIIVSSRIASIILHPLFMTAIVAFTLYSFVPGAFRPLSTGEFSQWMDRLFLCTVVLPFMCIFLFKITGLITNAKMHKPKDRVLPLIATMTFYILAYVMLVIKYDLVGLVRSLLLGSCVSIAIILVINFFYKVSVHTSAAGILPGMCIVVMMTQDVGTMPVLVAVSLAILVGAIRWFLGSHTVGQIFLGYAVGIFSQIGSYLLLNT